ncbi:MAG: A/G-specific adenine glycosylase [Fimbriimonadaceae bacterium]
MWVSEVMLQQTGVAAVVPYFNRWMERFPTVMALAKSDEQEVLGAWQGLGYYRRCRNLLAGARLIAVKGWPPDAAAWRTVPGVGRYTAGAIASIALNESTPVVDGNVERVYARLNADPASGAELNRRAWAWASQEMRAECPGDWNQALMELGATVCSPAAPRCGECPVSGACKARKAGSIANLPTVVPKRRMVRLVFDVTIPACDDRFGLRKIPAGQWWEGMWEFPSASRGSGVSAGIGLQPLTHTVTHHRITLHATVVQVAVPDAALSWFDGKALDSLPMPSAQRKLLVRAQEAIAQIAIPKMDLPPEIPPFVPRLPRLP